MHGAPRRRPSFGRLAAVEASALALAALSCLWHLALDAKNGAGSLWSGERLAFAVGILRGYDIYPGPHRGVITGDVYGPMLAVFNLPAALVPTITGKMVAGALSSTLVMLLPLVVLARRVTRALGGTTRPFVACLTLLTGVLVVLPATNLQLYTIAADAPCLGFGMGAFLVITGAERPGYGRLAGAAALVALATLSKPNGAFVAFGVFLLVVHRVRFLKGVVFGALYLLLTAVFAVLVVRGSGSTLAGVWYNDVVIPSSQFVHHDLRAFIRGMGKLTLPMFALLAATLAPRFWPFGNAARERYRVPAAAIELWLVAWVLVPISYLGRAKIGGAENSFHAHYFAAAGTVMAWVPALVASTTRPLRGLAFAVLAWLAAPFGQGNVFGDWTDNTHERVFDYLRAHRDAYFPWHPLATLEATGQYWQQSDGVYSRQLASRAPTCEEFLAHAPRNPAVIGLPRTQPFLPEEFVFTDLVRRYYPGYELVSAPAPELAALRLQIFARSAGVQGESAARAAP